MRGLALALLVVVGCKTHQAEVPLGSPLYLPQRMAGDEPCDMPGNPREPAFITLESMLSAEAEALSRTDMRQSCRFELTEFRGTTNNKARQWCRNMAKGDVPTLRGPCLELCLTQIDWDEFYQLHQGIVSALQALGGSAACPTGSIEARWACANGPRLPPSLVLSASDAGLPRVEGHFVDGGATWVLEVVNAGACGRPYKELRQQSPLPVCDGMRIGVGWCNVERL
jgi:hypothetical protein